MVSFAVDFLDDLPIARESLEFYQYRQCAIAEELPDIVSGFEAFG